jgi:hypothetical protein
MTCCMLGSFTEAGDAVPQTWMRLRTIGNAVTEIEIITEAAVVKALQVELPTWHPPSASAASRDKRPFSRLSGMFDSLGQALARPAGVCTWDDDHDRNADHDRNERCPNTMNRPPV